MGAPLFGSPGEFIATMKGQGILGPLLSAMGMKPVKFQSEADFGKSISTESKVFSVYAVGVVKGYKRETRVRVHEVVDFRSSPSLGDLTKALSLPGTGTSASSSSSSATSSSTTATDVLNGVTQQSVGGQVLYFSIE
jgi:general secretion pathway protein K